MLVNVGRTKRSVSDFLHY